MRSLLSLSLALCIAGASSPGWTEEPPASEPLSQRWASFLSTTNQQPGPMAQPLSSAPFQTTFSSTSFTPPTLSTRVRDLSPETDRARTEGFLASTKWLKGTLVTETEVANSLGGAGWLQSKAPGDTRDDAASRMIRVGLTGTSGTMRYGMMYRHAGNAFLNVPDQSVRELWGEWKTGFTTLRSVIGQAWNNVAGDATQARLEQTYGRVGLAWTKPAWPELSLTYAHNSLSSALEPLGMTPQRTQSHIIESALAYTGTQWTVRLASNYILSSDLLRNGTETNTKIHMLTASFRPMNTLTITPMLIYREEIQPWSGVRTEAPAGSLALQYKHSRQLLISATGNYTSTRSNDGLIDTESVGGKGTLAWNLQPSLTWTALLAIEAGYSRLSNRVTPSADTEDISGIVRLVLAAL
jgi:hypothetical protein